GFLGAQFNPADGMHFGNEGTVHHAGGSMRMSGNHTGVVNEDLRVEAYDNLYVCDVSVFPMIPAANPSLTLATLALRLADHLAAFP
nr:GMC family oxidoreductase [Burkholderiales bacterium]